MSDIHSNEEEAECLDSREGVLPGPDACQGPVEFNSLDGIAYWPRCTRHFEARMKRYEGSIEKYANSDVPPSWFDPTAAGERWDDDY